MLVDAAMPEPGGVGLLGHFASETDQLDRIVMLFNSHSQRNDSERCKALGGRSSLVKPFLVQDLADALEMARGGVRAELEQLIAFDEVFVESRAKAAEVEVLNVLLAEDNPVNQAVAVRLLEKAGHKVTVAPDGERAVELYESGQFDVILMDVQMPVMGGFEATQAIRAREARRSWALNSRWFSIPIIAMTAHAMEGDRMRCIEAGMDEYVSKPIRPPELFAAIERAVKRSRGSDEDTGGTAAIAPVPDVLEPDVADLGETLNLLDGDVETLQHLLQLFTRDFGVTVNGIKLAAAAGDMMRLADAVHTVKGSVGVFNAKPAQNAAMVLEKAARNGEKDEIPRLVADLINELNRLERLLRSEMLTD